LNLIVRMNKVNTFLQINDDEKNTKPINTPLGNF